MKFEGNAVEQKNLFLMRFKQAQKSADYPERLEVPLDKIKWDDEFEEYDPPYYVDRVVLEQFEQQGDVGWADPENIGDCVLKYASVYGEILRSKQNLPLNPFGRCGIAGRGELGHWGVNLAVDPIVTRIDRKSGLLQMILIERVDCGEIALPGGMVNAGETSTKALSRELREETEAYINFENATLVYKGYVADRRNTDNAWIETTACHVHLDPNFGSKIIVKGHDDAKRACWCTLTPKVVEALYASHAAIVRAALRNLFDSNAAELPAEVICQIDEILKF